MRLQKLTSLETDKLIEEFKELQKNIKHYKEILSNHTLQSTIIKEELLDVGEKYGDKRKTEIIPFSGNLTIEDMIAEEEMVITISHHGYIKRLPVTTWKTQNSQPPAKPCQNAAIRHAMIRQLGNLSSGITFSTCTDGAGISHVVRKTTPVMRLTNNKTMNKRAVFDMIPKLTA